MRALLVTAVVLAAVTVAVSGAAVTVDAEKPRRRMRPAKILPAVQRIKPVTVPKGDPRAQDNAPAQAAAAVPAVPAVPSVPATPAVVNKVVPSPPTTDMPQRPATPTAFWPAAPAVLNVPAGAEAVAAKAAAAAQVGPVKPNANPSVYAATFQTMDGMPMISNDPNVVESAAILSARKLEAKAVPNPTVVTVVQQPLPAGTPAVVPGTAPLNPRRGAIGALKSSGPSAAASSAAAAGTTAPPAATPVTPKTTRVLKLGATAGDNPCVRQGGQCQDSSTCGGIVTRLLCPGPPSITCCTYTTPACAALGGSCRDQGTCQGDMKPGLCGDNSAVSCCVTGVPGWQGPLLPNKVAGNCLANFNPTAFADRARKFLKDYTDESPDAVKASEMAAALGIDARVTSKEPASLVTGVLDTLGWGCPFNADTGKTIASITEVVKTRGGLHPYPKVGDVALWTAHTGIVVDLCVGGRLDMVTMSPAAPTDKPQTNMRATGCVPLQTLATANPGSAFLGFWTPQ